MKKEVYGIGGKHVLADLHGVNNSKLLNSYKDCAKIIREAIKLSGAKIVSMSHKNFKPQGLTITAVLSESSLDFHTYPEHGYLSVSIYTCGKKADPVPAIYHIVDSFMPTKCIVFGLKRGLPEGIDIFLDVDRRQASEVLRNKNK